MIELTLSTKGFDKLVDAVSKTKTGTTTIRVSIEHLEKLIVDHGRLLRAVSHKEGGVNDPA